MGRPGWQLMVPADAAADWRYLMDALGSLISSIYLSQLPAILLIAAAVKTLQLIAGTLPI